jgi:hypothetical protein
VVDSYDAGQGRLTQIPLEALVASARRFFLTNRPMISILMKSQYESGGLSMRKPAVTENIVLDGVNEASPGWLAPAGEHRAPPLQHEWTR